MINLNIILVLLFIFFMIGLGQINYLKREVRKLNKIVKILQNKERKG